MILILDAPIEHNAAGKIIKGVLRTIASKAWEERQAKKRKIEIMSRL